MSFTESNTVEQMLLDAVAEPWFCTRTRRPRWGVSFSRVKGMGHATVQFSSKGAYEPERPDSKMSR